MKERREKERESKRGGRKNEKEEKGSGQEQKRGGIAEDKEELGERKVRLSRQVFEKIKTIR